MHELDRLERCSGAALQAPHFATDARIRGTHCKSREELEAEEMASMPHFKARAIKSAYLCFVGMSCLRCLLQNETHHSLYSPILLLLSVLWISSHGLAAALSVL